MNASTKKALRALIIVAMLGSMVLSACAGLGPVLTDDELVSTKVAATLNAQGAAQPAAATATQAPAVNVVVYDLGDAVFGATGTIDVPYGGNKTTEVVVGQNRWRVTIACDLAGECTYGTPKLLTAPTAQPTRTAMGASDLANNATWLFDYPNAGLASGKGWVLNGLPTQIKGSQLVATGIFKNTVGQGSQGWLAEPGTKVVGPEYPEDKAKADGSATEYMNEVNHKLIDHPGDTFHINEDRIDLCSFGSAVLEFNGVTGSLTYAEGHNYFLIIRGLFPDGKQDSDRNHTILFHEIVGSHAQCISYPGNGGGFLSEGNFLQNVKQSHLDMGNCGAEGCSKLTVLFVDLNTGALSVLTQANTGQPWIREYTNWQ